MTATSTILDSPRVHGDTTVSRARPLHVVTPADTWAYAVSFPAPVDRVLTNEAEVLVTRVDIEVLTGRVGIGWTNEAGNAYLEERFAPSGRARIAITIPIAASLGRLVLRNATLGGVRSEFVLHAIELDEGPRVRAPYLVSIDRRDLPSEVRPVDGGLNVFDDEAALAINRARMAWLEAADLPVAGKRVLDVGCGVGNFAPHYLQRGCNVVGIDGREENVAALRQRYPAVQGHVADIQQASLTHLGQFDVVHCFGLLYHLDSPVAALRNIHSVCGDLLILETMVCDSSRPLAVLADETKTINQALQGLGCRPSPSYVVLALNRVGFPYIYGTSHPPRHPDFQFEWRDALDISRDGHNLRAVFVASRHPLERPSLISLLDQ